MPASFDLGRSLRGLLFRGYLLPLLREHVGLTGALIGSSLYFGWAHLYLGWKEVMRTTLLGLLLAAAFLLTGSLWVPIALHALIDAYTGLLAYVAFRHESTAALVETAADTLEAVPSHRQRSNDFRK